MSGDVSLEETVCKTVVEKTFEASKENMKRNTYSAFIRLSLLCAAAFLGGCSQYASVRPQRTHRRCRAVRHHCGLRAHADRRHSRLCHGPSGFPRKYRASNTKATYTPKWSHSAKIDLVIWLVPVAIVTALGILAWNATHRLDPYKPIDSGVKPVSIEAVSLDWKWLFIYPDHNIAIVNQLVFPAKVPLSFRITSDTVMTSFFIPQLGSQIYAMAGMQTRLHLMADEPGIYAGQNQQFSGRGYADMHFKAIAVSREQFEAWVQKARTITGQTRSGPI